MKSLLVGRSRNNPQPTAVKICGITNAADALAAVDAGADMIGLNFFEGSQRFVTPDAAAEIVRQVRGGGRKTECVGVFVNSDPTIIAQIATDLALDSVQLHGNETPADCRALRSLAVIKALRVHHGFDPATASHFECDAILLDSWNPNLLGGTGAAFDWSIAVEIRRRVRRLILAGGLNPDNVAAAIKQVRPDAVDICSGVEDSPRQKNSRQMQRVVAAVRSATEK